MIDKPLEYTATVLKNQPVAPGMIELTLAPNRLMHALPGQFVQIQVPNAGHLLLRRPISINSYDSQTGTTRLVIQQKGEGTQRITGLTAGDALCFSGPFGRPFTLPESASHMAVVGGGVGIAPLLFAMSAYPAIQWRAFAGYRTQAAVYQHDLLVHAATDGLFIATDDGSEGYTGQVTALLADQLDAGYQPDAIWACGPIPMLRALQETITGRSISCMVSLEERMGCGLGACMGCVCRIGTTDNWEYQRVCADGPVFDLMEVVF